MISKTNNIKNWLIDVDGTIVNSMGRFEYAYNLALEQYGFDSVNSAMFQNRLINGRLLDPILPDAEVQHHFWSLLMDFFVSAPRHLSKPIPGVREALSAMRIDGGKVYLVTGRVCKRMELINEVHDWKLDDVVDDVFCIHPDNGLKLDVVGRQNKSLFFYEVLGQLAASTDECVYVTDWPVDAERGLAVGFSVIGVRSGGFGRNAFAEKNAFLVLPSIAAVPLWLGWRSKRPSVEDFQSGALLSFMHCCLQGDSKLVSQTHIPAQLIPTLGDLVEEAYFKIGAVSGEFCGWCGVRVPKHQNILGELVGGYRNTDTQHTRAFQEGVVALIDLCVEVLGLKELHARPTSIKNVLFDVLVEAGFVLVKKVENSSLIWQRQTGGCNL